MEPERTASEPRPRPMERLLYEVKKVIVGQDHLLERMVVALLARGHLLVEGVPGLAKTMAIKTLAETIGGEFKRIQFTPDLVPADLVGTRIYNQKTGEFNTSLGPVFTNLLLADEINRAPAKVQSALLEVMQERQVTIGRETHKVPEPVPRPGHPEPDRDRGHLRAAGGPGRPLHAQGAGGLPDPDRGVRHRRAHDRPARAGPAGALDRRADRAPAGRSTASTSTRRYRVRRAAGHARPARRERHGMPELERYITFGASPRASINLILTARALAFVRGRDYALPQDVLDMALDVMRHRLVLSFEALSDNVTGDDLLRTVLGRVPVPGRAAPGADRRPRQRLSASSSASTGRSSAGWTACSRATTAACSTATASTSPTCASTSPATTSATSTGTSPRAWTRRTSASTSRTARSRPGSCSTSARRWTSARSTTERQKRTVLIDFVTTLARLLTRRGNRVGAVFYGSQVERTIPARGGRVQVLRLVERPARASRA